MRGVREATSTRDIVANHNHRLHLSHYLVLRHKPNPLQCAQETTLNVAHRDICRWVVFDAMQI